MPSFSGDKPNQSQYYKNRHSKGESTSGLANLEDQKRVRRARTENNDAGPDLSNEWTLIRGGVLATQHRVHKSSGQRVHHWHGQGAAPVGRQWHFHATQDHIVLLLLIRIFNHILNCQVSAAITQELPSHTRKKKSQLGHNPNHSRERRR